MFKRNGRRGRSASSSPSHEAVQPEKSDEVKKQSKKIGARESRSSASATDLLADRKLKVAEDHGNARIS